MMGECGPCRISLKNQRPPAEVAPAPSRGHPHTPSSALLVVADFSATKGESMAQTIAGG
jgi:hypothetical protein